MKLLTDIFGGLSWVAAVAVLAVLLFLICGAVDLTYWLTTGTTPCNDWLEKFGRVVGVAPIF